jgi:prolycopene isomerase
VSTQGFDVAVVGAGIGGLAAASLLARAGRSVVLLDRLDRAGGVCQRLECDGYRFDIGATLLTGFGGDGPLASLCATLGISLPIKECDPVIQVALPHHRVSLSAEADRWWPEIRREFPNDEMGWRALAAELEALGEERDRVLQALPALPPEGWGERLRVWRVLTLGRSSVGPEHPRGVLKRALATPFRATMLRHGLGQASQRVLDASLWFLLLRSAAECSTLEAALALRQLRLGAASIPGGAAALVDAVVEQIQRDGGQLRLRTEAVRCFVDHGRIAGVVTADGETIRARWVVADVPPAVLGETLLPPLRGWLNRRQALDGPWRPLRVAQMMALAVPEALLPSELGEHCFIVQDLRRPARDENLVFVRAGPAWDEGLAPAGIRCLTVGRFVAPRAIEEGQSGDADLLDALEQVAPGLAGALVHHQTFPPGALGTMWGRPMGVVRYGLASPEWLGQRGFPHRVGWPGLFVVGEWTYPGRLLANVVEGAMRVANLIINAPTPL